MRDIPPENFAKFFDTVCTNHFFSKYDTFCSFKIQAFSLCPQLKNSRQHLRKRLGSTLLNRRQFLRRKGKIAPAKYPRYVIVHNNTLRAAVTLGTILSCMYVYVMVCT